MIQLCDDSVSQILSRNAHVFNFGGGFPGRQQQQRPQGPQEAPSFPNQLLSILPILLMLAFTFFAMRPSEPVSHPEHNFKVE